MDAALLHDRAGSKAESDEEEMHHNEQAKMHKDLANEKDIKKSDKSDELSKAYEVLGINSENNDIEKGGEGSKGGKVIGHTKSGKTIYEHNLETKSIHFKDKPHWAFGNNPYRSTVESASKELENKKIPHSIHYDIDDSAGGYSNKIHVIEFHNKEDFEKESSRK